MIKGRDLQKIVIVKVFFYYRYLCGVFNYQVGL